MLDEGGTATAQVLEITGGTSEKPSLGVNIEVGIDLDALEKSEERIDRAVAELLKLWWIPAGLLIWAFAAC